MESEEDLAPHVSVNAQYIKDLSFENPSAPASLIKKESPKVDLSLDIDISRLSEDNVFEVVLHIEVRAKSESATLFIVDLRYAGVFSLINIPEDQQKLLLAIHCPSIIFPFARRIIADVTQDGGFQPLMIDPIDFAALFHKKMMEENSQIGNA
jgi:preprotein translocase subunit SecB